MQSSMLGGIKAAGYLLFLPESKSQVLAAQTCSFHPSGHGPGLSGKELGFHSEAICGSSMEAALKPDHVSFHGFHCLHAGAAGPSSHTGSQNSTWEQP